MVDLPSLFALFSQQLKMMYVKVGVPKEEDIIVVSVAFRLINQTCVYSPLDVVNAFPSLGNHLAFTRNYSFLLWREAL